MPGLSIATLNRTSLPEEDDQHNRYLYNGKEFQDDNGLGWYDYGARYYDPQVGRWWSMDPLTEWHFNNSMYAYVRNNPVFFIDPFGLESDSTKTLVQVDKGNPAYQFDIDEVVHVCRKPKISFWQRFKKWWKSGDKTGGNSTVHKKYAEPWTLQGGRGRDNTIADEWGPGGSLDLLMVVNPGAGSFTFNQKLAIPIALQKAGDILNNIKPTSDRDIIENHNGIGPITNPLGQKINLSLRVTHYNIHGERYTDSSFIRNGKFHFYLKHESEVDSFDYKHTRYIKIK